MAAERPKITLAGGLLFPRMAEAPLEIDVVAIVSFQESRDQPRVNQMHTANQTFEYAGSGFVQALQ